MLSTYHNVEVQEINEEMNPAPSSNPLPSKPPLRRAFSNLIGADRSDAATKEYYKHGLFSSINEPADSSSETDISSETSSSELSDADEFDYGQQALEIKALQEKNKRQIAELVLILHANPGFLSLLPEGEAVKRYHDSMGLIPAKVVREPKNSNLMVLLLR